MNYAKLSRISALLTDFFVFHIFFILMLVIFVNSDRGFYNILVIANSYLFLSLSFIFINGFLFNNYGGTIGKILCGIKVLKQENNQYLNFSEYFFREYVAKIFSGVLVFLGYIYIFFNPKAQGFHDLMADTIVTKEGSLKPILLPIVTGAIFFILVIFISYKFATEGTLNNINNHYQVLGAQTQYHIDQIRN